MLSTAETPTAAALPVEADAATAAADAAREREATKLEKRLVRQVAPPARFAELHRQRAGDAAHSPSTKTPIE